jgi:hypothetical protein
MKDQNLILRRKLLGPGKTTYTFLVTFRFPLRPFSVLPAGRGGDQAETESSLALAENVYVILPTPKTSQFFENFLKG